VYHRFQLWAPVVVYMALLTFLPQGVDLSRIERVSDKALHVGAYMALGGLTLRAFHGGWPRLRGRAATRAALLTLGYGAADELYQAVVPWRDPSVLDWLADAVGMGLAILATGLGSVVKCRWNGGS